MTDPPVTHPQDGLADAPPRVRRRSRTANVILLAAAAISLVVLAPTLGDVYGKVGLALRLDPRWLIAILGCETASFVCAWDLQRLLLRTARKADIAAAQLAGNAVSQLVPGGGPAGTAVQLRILLQSGIDTSTAVGGLAASGVIGNAALLTLPVIALPAILTGEKIDSRLEAGVWFAGVLLVILVGAVIFSTRDRVLRAGAGFVQWAVNVVRRGRGPSDLAQRAMRERALLADALRRRWPRALGAAAGRTLGDFLALYCALIATGAHATVIAALAALAAANIAGMVPVTPGGLGFVEAGLAGALAVAGVARRPALIAAAAYRLVSSAIPILIGLAALAWSQRKTTRAANAAGGAPST